MEAICGLADELDVDASSLSAPSPSSFLFPSLKCDAVGERVPSELPEVFSSRRKEGGGLRRGERKEGKHG